MPTARHRIRDNPPLDALPEPPRAGPAPAPKEIAAGVLLKRVQLGLDVAAHLRHQGLVPTGDRIGLALAAGDAAARAGRGAAVRVHANDGGAAPLADKGRRDGVGARKVGGLGADAGDVLGLGEGNFGVGEDLVEMRVDSEGAGGAQRAGGVGPRVGALECVVHDDHQVGVRRGVSDGLVGVAHELDRGVELVATLHQGFVDELKPDDSVGVLGGAIFLGHGGEDGNGLFQIVPLLPENITCVAGIIKSVLGARLSVTVHPHLHASCSRPSNGLVQVSVGALEIWSARVIVRPEADRNPKSRVC